MTNPKPTCCLWDKDYGQQWKDWLRVEIMSNEYETFEEAMKIIMTKCNGKMNPQYIKDTYMELQND